MNPPLKLLDIVGTSNTFDFSSHNKYLIYSHGSIIIFHNLKSNLKTFINFHQSKVSILKFLNNDTQFISIDNSQSPVCAIWECAKFTLVLTFEIKTPQRFITIKTMLENFQREKSLALFCGKVYNLLYIFDYSTQQINYICNNIPSSISEVYGFKVFYNSNDFVLMQEKSIHYYRLGENLKQCQNTKSISFPFKLIYDSLKLSREINIIAFLTDKGTCLLYDQNFNGKPSINPNEQENFTACDFAGDCLICGTSNGKIYSYSIFDYRLKYYIDGTKTKLIKDDFLFGFSKDKRVDIDEYDKNINYNDSTISYGPIIKRLVIDNQSDCILIQSCDNSILIMSLNDILKELTDTNRKISRYYLYSYSHFDTITNITPCTDGVSMFYSCSRDQSIQMFNFNEGKISNYYFDLEKIKNKNMNNYSNVNMNKTYITVLQFHPLFNNKLFAGDNKGALYLFDTKQNIFQYKKFIIGTFAIVHITFNSKGNYICIGFETGMNALCNLNKECEFLLKITEHFYTPNEIEKRKIKNQKMGYSYFFTNTTEDALLYLKSPNEIEIGTIVNFSINPYRIIRMQNCIFDICVHASENYVICLNEINQIYIHHIFSGEICGVIDLNDHISYSYNFDIDPSGLFLAVICDLKVKEGQSQRKSNIIFFKISNGNVQCYNYDVFPISRIKFDSTGMFIGVAGEDGSFSIWELPGAMSSSIWDVSQKMKSNKDFWKEYEIQYEENLQLVNELMNSQGSNFKRAEHNQQIQPEFNNKDIMLNKEKTKFNEVENEEEKKVENIFEYNLQNSEMFEKKINQNEQEQKINSLKNELIPGISQNNFINNNRYATNSYEKNIYQTKSYLNEPKSDFSRVDSGKNQQKKILNEQNSFKSKDIYINKIKPPPQFDFPKMYNPPQLKKVDLISKKKQDIKPFAKPYSAKQSEQFCQMQSNNLIQPERQYKEENKERSDKISEAISEILLPEEEQNKKFDINKGEDFYKSKSNRNVNISNSIDKDFNLNKSRGSIGNSELNMSTQYFINNKQKEVKRKIYPEPDDIDDVVSVKANAMDKNQLKYPIKEEQSLSIVTTQNQRNQNSFSDDIDYLNDNIMNFEERHNLK